MTKGRESTARELPRYRPPEPERGPLGRSGNLRKGAWDAQSISGRHGRCGRDARAPVYGQPPVPAGPAHGPWTRKGSGRNIEGRKISTSIFLPKMFLPTSRFMERSIWRTRGGTVSPHLPCHHHDVFRQLSFLAAIPFRNSGLVAPFPFASANLCVLCAFALNQSGGGSTASLRLGAHIPHSTLRIPHFRPPSLKRDIGVSGNHVKTSAVPDAFNSNQRAGCLLLLADRRAWLRRRRNLLHHRANLFRR